MLPPEYMERNKLGWDEVHDELYNAPFCEKLRQITKVIACRKCHVWEKKRIMCSML